MEIVLHMLLKSLKVFKVLLAPLACALAVAVVVIFIVSCLKEVSDEYRTRSAQS